MFNFYVKFLYIAFIFLFNLSLYSQDDVSQKVNDAKAMYDEYNYLDAIVMLEDIYLDNRYNLDLSFVLLDSYIKVKNYTKANGIIEDLMRYHPKNEDVLERKLNLLLIENKISEAKSFSSRVKSMYNKNYFSLYADAFITANEGYLKSALALYKKARLINSKRPEATIGLAYLELKLLNETDALKLFKENIENNPRMPESYYNLANYYYIVGDYNNALAEIENALYYNNEDLNSLVLKSKILSSLGNYNQATIILESIPYDYFDNESKYYIMGTFYEEAKNYNMAKDSYLKYLSSFPSSELARLAYERVLFSTNPTADAERDRAGMYYINLAAYYGRLADPIRSFAYYKHILRLNPANSYARMALYNLYKLSGYTEKAFIELSIARDINPTDKTIGYKYDSENRMLSRNVLSKSWGIDQYSLKEPGYSVAIVNKITPQEGSPRNVDFAMYDTLSYTLSQYHKMRIYELYDNNVTGANFYNMLNNNNINFYLEGSISQTDNSISMVLDLMDTRTRTSVTNFSVFANGKYKMMDASVMIGNYINNSIPFYANIVKIHNDNIYINAGRFHGITNDMTFAIYDTDKAEYDIYMRSINKKTTDIIAILKIVATDENVSLGKLVDGRELKNVRLNNVVVPYNNK